MDEYEGQLTQQGKKRRSVRGLASFILGIFNGIVLVLLAFMLFWVSLLTIDLPAEDSGDPIWIAGVVLLVLIVFGIIPVLVGFGLGVASLAEDDRNHGFAIAGMVINTLVFIVWSCGFIGTVS